MYVLLLLHSSTYRFTHQSLLQKHYRGWYVINHQKLTTVHFLWRVSGSLNYRARSRKLKLVCVVGERFGTSAMVFVSECIHGKYSSGKYGRTLKERQKPDRCPPAHACTCTFHLRDDRHEELSAGMSRPTQWYGRLPSHKRTLQQQQVIG